MRCGDARRLLQGCSCEGPRPYMRSRTGYGQLFTFKLTGVEGLSSKARCVSLEANPDIAPESLPTNLVLCVPCVYTKIVCIFVYINDLEDK